MAQPRSTEDHDLVLVANFQLVRATKGAWLVELLHETGRSRSIWVPKQLAELRDYNRQLWLPRWFIKRYRIQA